MEWTRVSITRPLLSGPTDFLFHPGQSYSIIVPEPYLTLTRYRHRHLATELRLFLERFRATERKKKLFRHGASRYRGSISYTLAYVIHAPFFFKVMAIGWQYISYAVVLRL